MGAAKLLTAAGGGVTLDAASTATDKTITVPADNGTLIYANASGNTGFGTSSPTEKVTSTNGFLSTGAVSSLARDGAFVDYSAANSRFVAGRAGGNYGTWQSYVAGASGVTLRHQIDYDSTYRWYAADGTTERMRLDFSGNLLVGTTSGSNHIILKDVAVGSVIVGITNAGQSSVLMYATDATGNSTANTGLIVRKVNATGRSINAAGTINASGADYAEYMTKAGDFTIAKGDVVGINAQGKLTNIFADAVSFCVKSTDPSYVGGDVWGSEEALGLTEPEEYATQEVKDAFTSALEEARKTVDRIAFAGQVPVNVLGTTAGQYIIPVNDNGSIKGEAISNPTFEQYQQAVGKVITLEQDGRARIIVKVA